MTFDECAGTSRTSSSARTQSCLSWKRIGACLRTLSSSAHPSLPLVAGSRPTPCIVVSAALPGLAVSVLAYHCRRGMRLCRYLQCCSSTRLCVCRPHAERYAQDQDNFFLEYAAAHKKLSENVSRTCLSFLACWVLFPVHAAACTGRRLGGSDHCISLSAVKSGQHRPQ